MQLSNPSRLVYAPHTYGPSVYAQKYFGDRGFPNNMAAIWNARFAFLVDTGSPVIIGEMGGFYTGKDRVWQDWAFSFMTGELHPRVSGAPPTPQPLPLRPFPCRALRCACREQTRE